MRILHDKNLYFFFERFFLMDEKIIFCRKKDLRFRLSHCLFYGRVFRSYIIFFKAFLAVSLPLEAAF